MKLFELQSYKKEWLPKLDKLLCKTTDDFLLKIAANPEAEIGLQRYLGATNEEWSELVKEAVAVSPQEFLDSLDEF